MTHDLETHNASPLALPPSMPTREQIDRFEAMLFEHAAEVGETPMETTYYDADGLYGRAITIPAGTALTGLPHKAGHMNVSIGDITVRISAHRGRHFTVIVDAVSA